MSECPDYRSEITRINRIQGQLDGIKRMINEGAYCPEILIQTKAISSAVRSLETTLLESHMNHCLMNAAGNEKNLQSKIDELKLIFKTRLK